MRKLISLLALGAAIGSGCVETPETSYMVTGCSGNFKNGPLLEMFNKCALSGAKLEGVGGTCTCACPGWDDKKLTEANYKTTTCPPFGEAEIADVIAQGLDTADVVEDSMTDAETLADED